MLGAIESGVDFERRIVAIYQDCRTTEAIDAEFKQLRFDLDEQIAETMDSTRRKLLEHFDAEVHDRLRVSLAESREFLDKATEQLWRVTSARARSAMPTFEPTDRSFVLDDGTRLRAGRRRSADTDSRGTRTPAHTGTGPSIHSRIAVLEHAAGLGDRIG